MNDETRSLAFDVYGPLPTGVTVLEASAGTGKTYTIAALAARHVADGTPLERLLLVTFTRMATGELRERVRERLVSAEQGLRGSLAGLPPTGHDALVALLADGAPDVVKRRRDRLSRALASFDGATIATTHGFCQEVLSGLGIVGDQEPGTTFLEDIGDLVAEVVDDLYVRRFHGGDSPPFLLSEAAKIADVATRNPATQIVPATGAIPEMRRRLALAVREEFEHRKRRLAVLTYDDLLTKLDDALSGDGGAVAAARLRARYDVVLVDEFQDTDPVQWDIMRRAFGPGDVTLVLIGDPKQAIYAFRGADVYAYLEAAREAGTHATLDINWRSDQALIDAYDKLFANAKLGHEGIVYRRVRAADANQTPRLTGAPCVVPLRIRVVHRDEPSIDLTNKGFIGVQSAREHIAEDLAADLVGLLSSSAEIERRSQDGTPVSRTRVRPGHMAVLVPTNRSAALIRDALDRAGIPAVINGAGSVFGTWPAGEWLRLLEAIERPTSRLRARSAALTCFFDWSAERVAAADEDDWEQVHRRLHEWARVLRAKGVASLAETITLAERLPQRILASSDGERHLTDLRHVGQLLHAAATSEQTGTTALTAWLRCRIAEAEQDTTDEERSRRLESDAEAVQVLTVHRSKGLEFPIVCLPFLWEPGNVGRKHEPVFFHDPDADDVRSIDVSLEGPDFGRHREQSVEEQRGEDLRLGYVALTRAQHQAVVWWASSWDSRNSSLGRLLFARDGEGNVQPHGPAPPDDALVVKRLEEMATEPDRIAVERSTLGPLVPWTKPAPEPAELTAAKFDRVLDWTWRRTSYSDITAGTYEARVGSEPEDSGTSDEPPSSATRHAREEQPGDPLTATRLPLGAMGVGADVGTLVHELLEATDFAAADLDAELGAQLATAQGFSRVDIGDPDTVVAGLRAAIETPLGPLLGGARLRDVQRSDRIGELGFELPLAGGDEPTGRLTLAAIGDVLREHLPADDPLRGYDERLDDAGLRRNVRGYLTGSLDLVVRFMGPEDVPRFAVLDYKTNWLGAPGKDLTAWDYRPKALIDEMLGAHYGLQALLYSVALHRYLRWRVPDYDAERNLAGVLYLFVRGMTGADTPTIDGTPCGVFGWRPPKALVEALSEVLDGRPAS